MKHLNRIIAFALTVAMVCSLTLTAYAAPVRTQADLLRKSELSAPKGFRSPEFQLSNPRAYEDDDVVRAIVLLDAAPEIERAGARAYREIMAEHSEILNQMSHLDFTKIFDFTSLINGFSIDIAYGKLDFIAKLPGVSSVHVANSYAAPEVDPLEPQAIVGGIYSGNTAAASAGYDGAGMVVAVIDTGLNTSHEAFQDVTGLCAESAVLDESCLELAEAEGVYLSPKVPFAYDYADSDNDVTDLVGHGTHVSGISTGYAVDEEEGAVLFRGAAPAAQLLSMKVFSDTSPSTTSDIYFRALEDAYRLGADVINMSLGAQNGFTYDDSLETEVFGNVYKRLDEAGIILSISAGNEGSMAENSTMGYIAPDYMDYGTVGTPSTYDGNLSVAAMENAAFPQLVIRLDGKAYAYGDSSMTPDDQQGLWRTVFGDQEAPFAVVKTAEGQVAIGVAEDYAANDVAGKIAVVQRGEISFQEKVTYAAQAGAIGLIVCNNEPGQILMSIQNFAVPAISVGQEMQEAFLNAESDTIYSPSKQFEEPNARAFEMCDFSGWGPTPSLTIDPAITSFGGNINSAYIENDTSYTIMSGTSMSAPFMTGTITNLLSYLQDQGFEDKVERAAVAEALLQSSATVAPDGDSLYAVRRQGSGVANVMNAIENYENAGYIVDPLKELGDDPEKTGVYSFDVTLLNTTDASVRYDGFRVDVLADLLANINTEEEPVIANMLSSGLLLSGGVEDGFFTVACDGSEIDSLELASGDSAELTVTITLDDDARAYLENFTNGSFVEGYFTCTANGEYENHATYLAFYGDWTEAPVVEAEDFRTYLDYAYQLTQIAGDDEGHSLAELGVSPLQVMNIYTMPNLAFGFVSETEEPIFHPGGSLLGDLPFKEEYIAFSTAAAEHAFCDSIVVQPFQLRNASALSVTVSDAESGEVYFLEEEKYVPKSMFDAQTKAWQSVIYYLWDGTDLDGEMVPSGTVVTIQMDAALPYGHDGEESTVVEDVWSFNATVDYTAPALDAASIELDPAEGTLTVSASDEHYLQAIFLRKPGTSTLEDTEIFDAALCAPETAGETFTATFDVKPLLAAGIADVDIVAMDFATNQSAESVSLIEKGQDATITLVSATGEITEQKVSTGRQFSFPECEEQLDGAMFDSWTTQQFEQLPMEQYNDVQKFYPGDKIVVTGDATYYALYAVGYEIELTSPKYGLDGKIVAGDSAIVGLGVNAEGTNLDPNHPFALGADIDTVDVTTLSDAVIDQQYLAFATENPGIRFTLEKAQGGRRGQYTLRNAASGLYLALDESGAAVMAEEANDRAVWNVRKHPAAEYAVEITSAADSKMTLLFNYVTNHFEVLDKDQVVGQNSDGQNVTAGEAFNAMLYNLIESEFSVDYMTTDASRIQHVCKWDAGVVTKEATCTEDGEILYTCQGCGKTKTEVIPAGHDWDEGQVTVEPSCSQEGEIVYTCSRCGETSTEVLPKLAHQWDNGVITQEPTCTEKGAKTYTCAACGETKVVELPDLGGHRYDNGTVTKEPGIGVEGEMTYVCLVCGETKVEKIPALDDPSEPVDPSEPAEPGHCYVKDFDDCKDDWYHEAVDFMVSKGLMTGVGNRKFEPNSGMTRAMMVTVLYSEAGKPEVSEPSTFTDVPADEWFSDPVAWAQDNQIVSGVTADKFAPNANITREQIAMILWRSAGSPETEADLSKFADDESISDYAVPALKWAVANGIMAGDEHTRLNPTHTATRAEFAVMMLRYLDGSYDCTER